MSKRKTKKIRRPQPYKKQKTRTFKEWYGDQTEKNKKLLHYAVAAVLALALLLTVYFCFIHDDGSLRIRGGEVVGAQDDWLITNLGTDSKKKYYHLADVAMPEGYYLSDESAAGTTVSSTTNYATTFTYKPLDDASPLTNVYISGVSKTPAAMVESVYDTFKGFAGEDGEVTPVTDVTTALGTAKYFTYEYPYTDDSVVPPQTSYTKSLVYYLPTHYKGASVLVSVMQSPDAPEDFLSEAELLAFARPFIDGLVMAGK